MTKHGLTSEEKAVLVGMGAVMNIDICGYFPCPSASCEECPLNRLTDLQSDLLNEIGRLVES